MRDSNSLESKICWVCNDCGDAALSLEVNKNKRRLLVSTFHLGKCDICNKEKAVTQTRDFGFPVFMKNESRARRLDYQRC